MTDDTDAIDLIIEEYGESAALRELVGAFGGSKSFSRKIRGLNDWDLEMAGGLPRDALSALFDELEWLSDGAELFLGQMRDALYLPGNSRDRISKNTTAVAVRIAIAFVLVGNMFTNPKAAVRFLTSRHPRLDEITPIEALWTQVGANVVFSIVSYGLHGLPAWTLSGNTRIKVRDLHERYPRAARLFATKAFVPMHRSILVEGLPPITAEERKEADATPMIEVRLDILERSLSGFRDTGTWDDFFPAAVPGGAGADLAPPGDLGTSQYEIDTND